MKFLFNFIFLSMLAFIPFELKADTLFESLNSAFLKNPKLNAERANMRAAIEEKENLLASSCRA